MFPILFQCTTQNREATSKNNGNIIRYIQHYSVITQKCSIENNKICQNYGGSFAIKLKRDRYVAKIYRDGELHEEVGSSSIPEEIIAETDDVVKRNSMVSNINESEVVFYASID